jgi:hypothetical protein
MKEHIRIYNDGYLFAQKSDNIAIIHITKNHKSLCGKDYFFAYFKPVAGYKLCKTCLKIYRGKKGIITKDENPDSE